MAPKIPAPITAPIPSMMRSPAPRARFRAYGLSPSTSSSAIGLRRNSCRELDKQRRQHQRDRAQQLDEHVQRRPRRVFERVADGVADHRRLVGRTALPAVLARLDELFGIVPGATIALSAPTVTMSTARP